MDDKTVIHAMKTLSQNYYDSGEVKAYTKMFQFREDKLIRLLDFERLINKKEYRLYIEDVINYGLVRYEREYGSENYGVPFLKRYAQYGMREAALLSNYEKMHSSFRGSGLITNGKEYFLFIDLHKEEDIKESINYKDEFKSRDILQWESPNSTKQDSERGKDIIFNTKRGVNLHIFIRKYKKIDGEVQSYIYIGRGNVVEYKGEKPITVLIKLENKVPVNLYREFVEKV